MSPFFQAIFPGGMDKVGKHAENNDVMLLSQPVGRY